MSAVAKKVQGVVTGLARSGAQGFHPSYVASQAEQPLKKVLPVLSDLARRGVLEETFELICPNCGRTVARYKIGEELPLGQLVECTASVDDPPFIPTERDFIVTYAPTASYLSKILRETPDPSGVKKKPYRRSGWRRIASLLSSSPRTFTS